MTQSEQRFRKLVEHSSDVITLLDADGRVTFSTDSLRATLGYAPGEMIGHSVFELIHPEDRRAAEPLFRDVLRVPGRAAKADLRVQHKDGSWRDLEVVAVNRLDDAAISAIVVNYHDVTERKRGADQLIFMPEIDGLEVIQRLRADRPQTKIIAMSGGGRSGQMDMLTAAAAFGASRTLRKPFEPRELIAAVGDVLGRP